MNKRIRSIGKTVLAASLAFSLTACSGGAPKTGTKSSYAYLLDTTDLKKPELDLENTEGVLKSVLKKGVLTIATSPDFPANEWVDEEGKVWGSEMMLAKYIADCLEVDLEIVQTEFSGTFTAVDDGTADAAFSGFGWKKDREEAYETTIGYVGEENEEEIYQTLIVTQENAGKYKTLQDLVGAHIMVQANSLQEMYCTDQIKALNPLGGTEIEPVGTLGQAVYGLESGACDAVALDGTTAENFASKSEGKLVLTGIKFDLSAYGDHKGKIGICKKGETSLAEVLNKCIKTANDEGYYKKWYEQAKEKSPKTVQPQPAETESSEEN